jgi:transketolase
MIIPAMKKGGYADDFTVAVTASSSVIGVIIPQSIPLVATYAGLVGGEREGVTLQFYEDVSILSAVPNFTIFLPADGNQTYHAVKEAGRIQGPVYIRAGSGREVDVYDKETSFCLDGIRILKDYGRENILFASGFIPKRSERRMGGNQLVGSISERVPGSWGKLR